MLLTNEFVVPRPIDQTWAVLTDIERIAPCMPGAQLTEVRGDEYHGKVKVKVGPMTVQFSGTATFKEQDVAAHRAVIEARGRDTSGKGRASALVTAVLVDEGSSTKVQVETDLTIAGPLAQMGRSTIGDISTRLLTQFVENLVAEVRTIDGPEAEAVDLTRIAGTGTLVKIAVPVVVLIAVIVALVVWLA